MKKMRFLSLKGAVEDGRIRWWRDAAEFAAYARTIKVAGWENVADRKNAREVGLDEPIVTLPVASRPHNRKRKANVLAATKTSPCFVYVLVSETCERPYIGFTDNVERRLSEHNEERNAGRGADATRGHQWRLCGFFADFDNHQTAYRFEALLQLSKSTSLDEVVKFALREVSDNPEYAMVKWCPYE